MTCPDQFDLDESAERRAIRRDRWFALALVALLVALAAWGACSGGPQ